MRERSLPAMRLGAALPQVVVGTDPAALRDWAVGVEKLGFSYLLALDHVLGARPGHPALTGSRFHFTHQSLVHEPLVLFGYLAAVTQRVELVSGILILPQRQTALVAKQASELDVLSAGRLRLGVGLGWNPVEFEALAQTFHNRGRRLEEQLTVLRLLWTQELVTFEGRWHMITEAGIHPRPVQQPIPIWFGATAERAIARAGRLGDGWLALGPPDSEQARRVQIFRTAAQQAGRDPVALELIGELRVRKETQPDELRRSVDEWRQLGANRLTLHAAPAVYPTVDSQLTALSQVQQVLATELT